MHISKYLIFVSFALSASLGLGGCGGGSSSTAATTPDTSTTLEGTVADGYLVGAKVCLDQNYNDICDPNEHFVITDGTGRYRFVLQETALAQFPLIVEANASTIDLDTNLPIGEEWRFKSMKGEPHFISPLTTLIAREMDLNTSLTLTQAMTNLQTELGLDINCSTDYIAANNLHAHNAAKIIARSLYAAETALTSADPAADLRQIRLLAAHQIRSQAEAVKMHAWANDPAFVCDVNTTDVPGQLTRLNASIASALSPQMQADLLFIWEEEKLARDVYLTLYEKWGSKIFFNIATNGEQAHIESVKSMIDKYAISTAAYGADTRGVFVNTTLQTLYNTLTAQGSVSVTEAYKVGQTIEITDINDLDVRLQAVGLPSDIRTIYENLRSASEKHLAAFNQQL